MDDFPSNSRRPSPLDKTAAVPPAEAPILEKIVVGTVITRKKSLGRRFRDTFFNGNSDSVFGYLLKDVLIPALQATVTDVITQGIERAVYGEVRSPNRSARGGSYTRPHISYDRTSTVGRTMPQRVPPARVSAVRPSAFQIGEVILPTQIEAQVIVDKLFETVEEYGMTTVANLKELIGETPVYTDHKYGWTDLTGMTAKRIREGYLLVLPEPEDLR